MKLYGLIGKTLKHSFSPKYFNEKFARMGIDAKYELIEVQNTEKLAQVPFHRYEGINVTIPYKRDIMKYCTELDSAAVDIGAVNTLKPLPSGGLKGHNTDWLGFKNSLLPLISNRPKKALVLGSGGSSKAVIYALQSLHFDVTVISRTPSKNQLTYSDLTPAVIQNIGLLVNTTPLGMFPDTQALPSVPVSALTKNTLVYDLIYNPDPTLLLKSAADKGCAIKSGREMLEIQAEESWNIWNRGKNS